MAIAAIRHNNPGNVSLPIQGWTGGGTIVGIKGQSGYASFPDMQTGYAAMQHRLKNYVEVKGLTTIRQLNTRYAEDRNWKFAVSRYSGIGLDDPIDTSNAAQMNKLAGGIIRQETGKTPAQLGINTDRIGASSSVSAENANAPWLAGDIPTPGVGAVKISGDLVEATDTQTIQQASSAAQQADAIIAAAAQQATANAASTQATLKSQEGWLGWFGDWASDWFVRGAIILLGLVLVGGALALLVVKGKDALPSAGDAALAHAV